LRLTASVGAVESEEVENAGYIPVARYSAPNVKAAAVFI
jgi:hypothetical protein